MAAEYEGREAEGTVPDRIGDFAVGVTGVVGFMGILGYGANTANGDGMVQALIGDTSAKLLWPENSIPVTVTMCSVSRWMTVYPGYGECSCNRIFNTRGSPTQSTNW